MRRGKRVLWKPSGTLLFVPALLAASLSTAAALGAEAKPYPPCERKPSDADLAAAKGAFEAGRAAYEEADYGRAITYWEDAFRRDCSASPLLLNLARAYESDGQLEQAVMALKTFNERDKNSTQRATNERRIARLEAMIAEQPPEPELEPAPPPPAAEEPPAKPAPAPEPETTVDQDSGSSLGPILTMSVGGGLFVLSGLVYLGARNEVNDFRETCPDSECPPDTPQEDIDAANTARDRAVASGWVSVVGLSVGVGGLVWWLTSDSNDDVAEVPLVLPRAGPDYAGVSVQSSF